MELTFSAETHVGRVREKNEDNYLIDPELQLFVVCDGMGGHAGGEVASSMCVRTVREYIMAHVDIITQFDNHPNEEINQKQMIELAKNAIGHANLQIFQYASRDASRKGMGTTCSLLMLRGNQAFISHVGDSRIYLSRDSKVLQVTDDHSLVMELVRSGRMSESEAKGVAWKNALTRAVGVRKKLEVATYHLNTRENDSFILCSDGLTTYLDCDDDRPLRAFFSAKTPTATTRLAVKFALQRGGTDNVTCLNVHVDSQDDYVQPDLESVRQILRKTPIFQSCNSTELMEIINCSRRFEIPAGRHIPQWNFDTCQFFIVLGGTIAVKNYFYHQTVSTLRVLSRGHYFGAEALFGIKLPQVEIDTHENTILLGLGANELQAAIKANPTLAVKMMWPLSRLAVECARQNVPPLVMESSLFDSKPFQQSTLEQRSNPERRTSGPQQAVEPTHALAPTAPSIPQNTRSLSTPASHDDDPGEHTLVDERFYSNVLKENQQPPARKIMTTPDPFSGSVNPFLHNEMSDPALESDVSVSITELLSQVSEHLGGETSSSAEKGAAHKDFITLFDDGDELDFIQVNPLRASQVSVASNVSATTPSTHPSRNTGEYPNIRQTPTNQIASSDRVSSQPTPTFQQELGDSQDSEDCLPPNIEIPKSVLQMLERDAAHQNPPRNPNAPNIEIPHFSYSQFDENSWQANIALALPENSSTSAIDANFSNSSDNDTCIDAILNKSVRSE